MPVRLSARPLARMVSFLTLLLAVSGVLLLGPASGAEAATRGKIDRATTVALNQKGDPYRYGAAGPSAFDCSGLIYYSFRKAGLSVPRTSSAQYSRTKHIAKKSLRRGDLMFFHNGGRVYHAAIFLGWDHGQAKMLHSPRTGQNVSVAKAWTSSWYAGTLRG